MTTVKIPTQFELKQFAYASDLKSRALSVLNYLIDRTNKELTCFPSISTIGKQLHISVSTVKRAMKELLLKGFLERVARFSEKKNGGQTSNLYILSIPQEAPPQESENEPQDIENIMSDIINDKAGNGNTEPQGRTVEHTVKPIGKISFDSMLKDETKIEPNQDIVRTKPNIYIKHKLESNENLKKTQPLQNKSNNENKSKLCYLDGCGVQFDTTFNLSV